MICPGQHWHLDIKDKSLLLFRFDICQNLTHLYKKFSLHPQYCSKILDNRRIVTRDFVDFFIPNQSDDLALRYMEYLENVDKRPDKIKHLNYINKFADQFFLKVTKHMINYANLYNMD